MVQGLGFMVYFFFVDYFLFVGYRGLYFKVWGFKFDLCYV
jgi:hypothetical protein